VRNPALHKAIVEHDYPAVERELLNAPQESSTATITGNLASHFIAAMIETQSCIMANAWLSALRFFSEQLSIATINNAVYVIASDFRSDREQFKHYFGHKFDAQVANALSPEAGLDANKDTSDQVILKLVYRTLFRLAPESRHWIRDNFLTINPLSTFMLGKDTFSYCASNMLPILNYVGITPDVLQDRVREILDAQLAVNKGSSRLLLLAAGTDHFDNAYFLKVINLQLSQPGSDKSNDRRFLTRTLLKSANLSDHESVQACIQALLTPGCLLNTQGLTTGESLLSLIALEANGTASHILRKQLYDRHLLTAKEIGPYITTPTHLKYALEQSGVSKDELLNYVNEDQRAHRLEADLGL
jgi:hypothetical protein